VASLTPGSASSRNSDVAAGVVGRNRGRGTGRDPTGEESSRLWQTVMQRPVDDALQVSRLVVGEPRFTRWSMRTRRPTAPSSVCTAQMVAAGSARRRSAVQGGQSCRHRLPDDSVHLRARQTPRRGTPRWLISQCGRRAPQNGAARVDGVGPHRCASCKNAQVRPRYAK